MKKIWVLTIILMASVTLFGQDAVLNDSVSSDSLTKSDASAFSAAKQIVNATKAEGDSAYIKNDFASAIQIYESLLQQGEAPEIYYNLGNCYYKTDDIARAILNYERALLLSPGNTDIRANLEIARSKAIDKVTPVPEIFFITWIKSLVNSQSSDAWARTGIISFLLLLVSLAIFFFTQHIKWKKIGFSAAILFLIVTVLSNLFASQQKSYLTNRNDAIILSPSVTVRSTPSESGTSLFVLHEGRKVEIKDNSMREWKEIRLEDGKVGWVPSSSIEVI
ncbi:tetratricopeptide repeat protein [Caecibacteroides pullorum]|uniref:Tetratricopeptide repeat protein n=1 Tax=Caecibacteroides pullorum TaxID=2725562 RepID=A0AA40ZVT3_9BACT|nr:tetratricopeptide repeat protein [Caecibacteroides pullorum]MBM6858787.1 tetratricopeptide repeat protein [Caecibacteroides pullorum]MBV8059797.1 tetratricopeptide repeat protein [Caecibacteroides pullorum]